MPICFESWCVDRNTMVSAVSLERFKTDKILGWVMAIPILSLTNKQYKKMNIWDRIPEEHCFKHILNIPLRKGDAYSPKVSCGCQSYMVFSSNARSMRCKNRILRYVDTFALRLCRDFVRDGSRVIDGNTTKVSEACCYFGAIASKMPIYIS